MHRVPVQKQSYLMCDAAVPWQEEEEYSETSVGSILGESQRFINGNSVVLLPGVVKESLLAGQDLVIEDSHPKLTCSDSLTLVSYWYILGLSNSGGFGKLQTAIVLKTTVFVLTTNPKDFSNLEQDCILPRELD